MTLRGPGVVRLCTSVKPLNKLKPTISYIYFNVNRTTRRHQGNIMANITLCQVLSCSTKFLRELNFADWRFFVFRGNLFLRLGETGFSCWELIIAIFRKPPSIWNNNVVVF